MAFTPESAEDASAQETADGYFSPLASAKHVLLATFKVGRTPVSSRVRVVAYGDRAYFQAWSPSRVCKRLRHNDWVQVAPCTALGLYRYGPWLDATARLLAGEEASQAARTLARKHPRPHGGLTSLAYRVRGAQPVLYELQPGIGADAPGEEASDHVNAVAHPGAAPRPAQTKISYLFPAPSSGSQAPPIGPRET